MTSTQSRILTAVALCSLLLHGCEKSTLSSAYSASDPTSVVSEVADRYYATTLQLTPEVAYFSGIDLERHDGLENISLEAVEARHTVFSEMLLQLETVDADSLVGQIEWITHAYLLQELKATVAQRICRNELWNVNQMSGWHLGYSQIVQLQPVGTSLLREQSITRWSAFSDYIDQNIQNLEQGLKLGYSAPQSVAQRVITQVDAVLSLETEQSPFYSPAARDEMVDRIDIMPGQLTAYDSASPVADTCRSLDCGVQRPGALAL